MVNRWLNWAIVALAAALAIPGRAAAPVLTLTDVTTLLAQASAAAQKTGDKCAVAISDREGFILAVYYPFGPQPPPAGVALNLSEINAIDKAGTAAYLSSGGEAFTSRTAGFIIQPHFPPGIANTAPGPLTGVGLSSLPFSDINHFRPATNPTAAIPNTSLSGNPGGVPLYKSGVAVGAIGVDSTATLDALVYVPGASKDEEVAMIAQRGFAPPSSITATNVLLNGIRLPYSSFPGGNDGVVPIAPDPTAKGSYAAGFPATASDGLPFNPLFPPPFADIPGGTVRNQVQGSLMGPVNNVPRLTQAEVTQILHQGAERALETRGAIRNPAGSSAEVFIVVVDYYSLTGTTPGTTPGDATNPPTAVPEVLGSFRTPDATIFSYDVAAQKARTALYFSNNTMAMSSRSVGFLAQGTYPPGINNTAPGPYGPAIYGPSNPKFGAAGSTNLTEPFFLKLKAGYLGYGLQAAYSFNPAALNVNPQPVPPPPDGNPISPNYVPNKFVPNGITIFPGGFPLYKQGQLIGAVGVSGDGVDQDDIIAASATVGFEAPSTIRADEFEFRGARLPYAKFPQDSSIGGY
jgi:uncharacterized protein GlcG (DUF336 family)